MGLFKFSPSKKLSQESSIVNFFQNLICNDTIHFMISISLSSTYALLTNMIAKIKIPSPAYCKILLQATECAKFLALCNNTYVSDRTHVGNGPCFGFVHVHPSLLANLPTTHWSTKRMHPI